MSAALEEFRVNEWATLADLQMIALEGSLGQSLVWRHDVSWANDTLTARNRDARPRSKRKFISTTSQMKRFFQFFDLKSLGCLDRNCGYKQLRQIISIYMKLHELEYLTEIWFAARKGIHKNPT